MVRFFSGLYFGRTPEQMLGLAPTFRLKSTALNKIFELKHPHYTIFDNSRFTSAPMENVPGNSMHLIHSWKTATTFAAGLKTLHFGVEHEKKF